MGHEKSSRHVDGRDQDGEHRQQGTGSIKRIGQLQHSANHDNAADRIGDTHQRRMQCRRDVPDQLPANKTGQHKNGKVRDKFGGSIMPHQPEQPKSQHRESTRQNPMVQRVFLGLLDALGWCHCSGWFSRRRRRISNFRWRPGDFSVVSHQRSADDLIFQIDLQLAVFFRRHVGRSN